MSWRPDSTYTREESNDEDSEVIGNIWEPPKLLKNDEGRKNDQAKRTIKAQSGLLDTRPAAARAERRVFKKRKTLPVSR